MSNDGTNYKPWKVRKGVFKSTGTSDYAVLPRNTPSPIIEMPMSPAPNSTPKSPMSPRVTIIENPLSPPILVHRNVREIPVERFDEVSEKLNLISLPQHKKEEDKTLPEVICAFVAFKNK